MKLHTYIAVIQYQDADRLEEVVYGFYFSLQNRTRRIGAVMPAPNPENVVYSVKLTEKELAVVKLAVPGQYKKYLGKPGLEWQAMVNPY